MLDVVRKPVKNPLLLLHHSLGLPGSGAGEKLAERDAAKEPERKKNSRDTDGGGGG